MRILLVEDHLELSHWLAKALRDAHLTVETAHNGADADALLHTQEYSLVLLDLTLPKMDGLALIKSLRTLPGYAKTPILMLTTESSDEMKSKGRAAGANGWLVKPFDPQRLIEVVKKVIG